ncbi:MAG: outer membrane beta-barrel protein [Cyclobacteriaceae bacterium]|nr:outer membrane beta-barrel protein [Cyclobacteriaceae bacterium]
MNKTITVGCCRLLSIAIFFILISGPLFSQEQEKAKWHYLGELYLMFPKMKGEVGIAELPPATIDADQGSIFSHLQMGAMFYLEATNDNWAISSDFIYMKLGQGVEPSQVITSGDVTMKQLAWELAGLKRITPWLDGGLGGRLVSLYTGLDLETIFEPKSGSADKTWFDPVIILRSNNTVKEKWLLQLRGDIGGFGLGSDFSWQIQANVGYRFSKLFQTSLGYRYIGINYDSGEGLERFRYDVDTYGLVLRIGFNF